MSVQFQSVPSQSRGWRQSALIHYLRFRQKNVNDYDDDADDDDDDDDLWGSSSIAVKCYCPAFCGKCVAA